MIIYFVIAVVLFTHLRDKSCYLNLNMRSIAINIMKRIVIIMPISTKIKHAHRNDIIHPHTTTPTHTHVQLPDLPGVGAVEVNADDLAQARVRQVDPPVLRVVVYRRRGVQPVDGDGGVALGHQIHSEDFSPEPRVQQENHIIFRRN